MKRAIDLLKKRWKNSKIVCIKKIAYVQAKNTPETYSELNQTKTRQRFSQKSRYYYYHYHYYYYYCYISIIKSLFVIIIAFGVIISTFTDFLVPLLFVLFFLYTSWFAIIFIFFSFLCFLFVLFCFAFVFFHCFSFYFWLNNSLSHMKWLRLVSYFVCLFCSLSWNCRVKFHNLITFLQFPEGFHFYLFIAILNFTFFLSFTVFIATHFIISLL